MAPACAPSARSGAGRQQAEAWGACGTGGEACHGLGGLKGLFQAERFREPQSGGVSAGFVVGVHLEMFHIGLALWPAPSNAYKNAATVSIWPLV